MAYDTVKVSKFLSLVLRHKPDSIGLMLDPKGWADVGELIERAATTGTQLTRDLILHVVATSDKQRFALDTTGLRIRANQGHSIDVDLGLAAREPPPTLFHGTTAAAVASIRTAGLHAAQRQYVHLSPDEATAIKVGQRHGPPVVLRIDAARMAAADHAFFLSTNGVWLTDSVPAEFIAFPRDQA
jgi:putative RNA 2'-phosphotransferase